MKTYRTKCGKIINKNTNADTTGNRLDDYGPGHECYGCPFVVTYDIAGTWPNTQKGYECRCSAEVQYQSYFSGGWQDKNTAHIYTLDMAFLQRVMEFATELEHIEPNPKALDNIRGADYQLTGMCRLTLLPASNKKGMEAKRLVYEEFFDPETQQRRDVPDEDQEKAIVLQQIENCKAATLAKYQKEHPEDMSLDDAEALALAEDIAADEGLLPSPAAPVYLDENEAPLELPAIPEDPCEELYEFLKESDSEFLRERARLIRDTTAEYATTLGKALAESQDRLASYYEGTFEKWYTKLGMKRQTVYNLIQRYRYLSSPALGGPELVEQLPLTLSYAISAPDAPKELVQQVMDGDITTHAEYQKLKKELEEANKRADEAAFHFETVHKSYGRLEKVNEGHYNAARDAEQKAAEMKEQLKKAHEAAEMGQLQITDLLGRIKELENQPVEVAVKTVSEATMAALRSTEEKKAAAIFSDLREKLEAQLAEAEDKQQGAMARIAELEAATELAAPAPPPLAECHLKCKSVAHTLNAFVEMLESIRVYALPSKDYEFCVGPIRKSVANLQNALGVLQTLDAEPEGETS